MAEFQKNDWHKVDDEKEPKPSFGEKVLCYDEDGDIFIAEFLGDDGYYRYVSVCFKAHPTHWHKLPKAPKGGEV